MAQEQSKENKNKYLFLGVERERSSLYVTCTEGQEGAERVESIVRGKSVVSWRKYFSATQWGYLYGFGIKEVTTKDGSKFNTAYFEVADANENGGLNIESISCPAMSGYGKFLKIHSLMQTFLQQVGNLDFSKRICLKPFYKEYDKAYEVSGKSTMIKVKNFTLYINLEGELNDKGMPKSVPMKYLLGRDIPKSVRVIDEDDNNKEKSDYTEMNRKFRAILAEEQARFQREKVDFTKLVSAPKPSSTPSSTVDEVDELPF